MTPRKAEASFGHGRRAEASTHRLRTATGEALSAFSQSLRWQAILSSPIFLAVLLLMGVGAVQVYSSSLIFASETFGDGMFFFERQLLFVVMAVGAMVFVAHLPWAWVERWGWLLWAIAAIGIAATLVPGVGVRVGGATRWLNLPGAFRFEPSELLKFTTAFWFCAVWFRSETVLAKVPRGLLWLGLAVPVALLLRQPDFGSFIIVLSVFGALMFAFGLAWRWVILAHVLALPAFYFLVLHVPYRKARWLAFLDPWADADTKGFQVIQSMLSFSSGGATGVGLGQGQGKLFFLPEAHTDFTLAVLGEEAGFVGVVLLLCLYAFLVWRGFWVAKMATSQIQKAIALGISITFALSVFINAGVVLGLLPTKGLTLPFLSYGGSSLMVLAMSFGLLINLEQNLLAEQRKRFLRM